MDNKGFTLIELMVTIAILAILTVMAVPKFSDAIKRHEKNAMVHEIRLMLLSARSMAFTNKNFVIVCPTVDNVNCTKNSPNKLISFMDKNQNKKYDQNDEMISSINIQLKHGYLKFGFGGRKSYMRFSPNNGKPIGSQGNITYCDKENKATHHKSVIMSEHGVARISTDANLDGIDENSQGSPLSC